MVLDDSQKSERYTGATFLANAGIPTRTSSRYAIMHNKFLVIDGRHVQTGSFNYTISAQQRNAENVIVLWNQPAIAAAYGREWQRLWREADDYQKRY
jgi:phosphatidylserine/phosphatidylglycerophosphate/cardiolipin synthase-like enzyme